MVDIVARTALPRGLARVRVAYGVAFDAFDADGTIVAGGIRYKESRKEREQITYSLFLMSSMMRSPRSGKVDGATPFGCWVSVERRGAMSSS